MNRNPVLYKVLVVGIILLLLCMSFTPSVAIDTIEQSSIPISDKTVITVDDEGDGDYTSIKQAVQNAQPGYTIEVYSGTYFENSILLLQPELTLKGMPYEMGSGNDTGKPTVTSELHSYNYIFNMGGDSITITGFRIIDYTEQSVFRCPLRIMGDRCTFSYNDVYGGYVTLEIGEDLNHPNHYSLFTNVIGNKIQRTVTGISYSGKYGNISRNIFISCKQRAININGRSTSNIISYNIIDDCSIGIEYSKGSNSTISHNLISSDTGIKISVADGENITVKMNRFKKCGTGIYVNFYNSLIKVHQNNFINNRRNIRFVRYLKNKYNYVNNPFFDENYYSNWKRFGSKWIRGTMILFWIPIFLPDLWFGIPIRIPWFYPDLNPAKEPYDIW